MTPPGLTSNGALVVAVGLSPRKAGKENKMQVTLFSDLGIQVVQITNPTETTKTMERRLTHYKSIILKKMQAAGNKTVI